MQVDKQKAGPHQGRGKTFDTCMLLESESVCSLSRLLGEARGHRCQRARVRVGVETDMGCTCGP
jgi:hypothetical protein